MNFVLDCSVTIPWLRDDHSDPYAEAVLESLENYYAYVPILWSYEVANALVTAQRKNLVSPSQTAQFLDQIRDMNIVVQTIHDLKHDHLLVDLGHSYGLTAYDSAYLKLAMVRGLPMATHDEALKKACKRAGVSLYKP